MGSFGERTGTSWGAKCSSSDTCLFFNGLGNDKFLLSSFVLCNDSVCLCCKSGSSSTRDNLLTGLEDEM